jgi:hypothetical protein
LSSGRGDRDSVSAEEIAVVLHHYAAVAGHDGYPALAVKNEGINARYDFGPNPDHFIARIVLRIPWLGYLDNETIVLEYRPHDFLLCCFTGTAAYGIDGKGRKLTIY